jgi:hypothetical protein|tara:strand:- start:92 stop:427 length:336 start_codon:yes stop_codon:yes gene_type:complete
MKQYNNGQRPQKMYGGGMTMPRKPMMLGGLADRNKSQGTMSAKTQDAMGMMTQQKKFGMGYNLGGAIKKFEKKSNGGKTGAKPDYLDFDKDGNKTESMKKALKDKKGKGKA